MADSKVTALPENTTPIDADLLMLVDDVAGTAASEKITLANIKTYTSASPTLVTPELGAATATSVTLAPSTTPTSSFGDSDSLDADKNIAQIKADATTVTAGAVVSDMEFTHKDGGDASGSFTTFMKMVGADNELQVTPALKVAGTINGGVDIYTYATSQTLTVAQCRGSVIYVTGAATISLPARFVGFNVIIITIGAVAVSIDPIGTDLIYLDGVALDDGDKITNTSTAGDIATITDYDATGFYAATNDWTDGGA